MRKFNIFEKGVFKEDFHSENEDFTHVTLLRGIPNFEDEIYPEYREIKMVIEKCCTISQFS